MSRTVLVVSHEASRTGAPRVAEHLMRALAAGGWDVDLLHRWGGPMRPELDAVATTARLEPLARARVTLRRNQRTEFLARALERQVARAVLRRRRPDLVWCNTVLTSVYARAAVQLGIPVVLYGHEQPDFVRHAVRRSGITAAEATAPVMTLVGCSTEAAEVLAAGLGAPVASAGVLHSPVDVGAIRDAAAAAPAPSVSHPAVVACGTGDRRKGIDVYAAAATADAGSGIDWVWVGRVDEADRVPAMTCPGELSSALPWLAAADVVALPSRADAFPLVVLEAMALGKPIVASDVAGPAEQLGDTGRLVPAEDADALRAAVAGLLADDDARARLGAAAAARCEERWDVGPFGERARAIADAAVG